METYSAEFSKFLDKTNYHLCLQAISSYLNLPEQLKDNEKEFIQSHLAECKSCTNSYELIFDETLNLDGKKNIIDLFRQSENKEEESTIYNSKNNQIEVEITRLDKNDFNLRFKSLPPQLIKEKAALKASGRYFLRILSMDTETMFIVHSEEDIMDLISFELISVTVPAEIPVKKSEFKPEKTNSYFWYAVTGIIIGAALIIYLTLQFNVTSQNGNPKTLLLNDKTTDEKTVPEQPIISSENKESNVPEKDQSSSMTNYFEVNDKLENILERDKRNNPPVALVSPSIGATVKMPVTFEWLTSKKNVTLKFVILTNQNIPVYNNLINGRELTIDTKLDPGLYYWKLESRDSVEALGKFLIR